MRYTLIIAILFLLLLHEVACVYFIMPFPGSQEFDSVHLAYFLNTYTYAIRSTLLLALASVVWKYTKAGAAPSKFLLGIGVGLYLAVAVGIQYAMTAEEMFKQPIIKRFLPGYQDTAQADKIVIAVSINGESAAYPIQLMGYHHQVRDTVGGMPILVTYCTVCRTGRVYSMVINGAVEEFRLVGMDHFNAMFEDGTTKSWWRQATGECVAGPLQGAELTSIASEQLTLRAWLRRHPNTRVLQPDVNFAEQYQYMQPYETGKSKGGLTKRDSASWMPKSWVVGVISGTNARTYDWNDLVRLRLVQDDLAGVPVLLVIERDNKSFHVYSTRVGSQTLKFVFADSVMVDEATKSVWSYDGYCMQGALQGKQLSKLEAYQEYLHSWEYFQPHAKRVATIKAM